MSEVKISDVRKHGDELRIAGFVDGEFYRARGWVSWTENYWSEPSPDGRTPKERRKMTLEEQKQYCRDLLIEAAGGVRLVALVDAE